MKIHKPEQISLMIAPFGLQGRLYLSIGALVYFDLTAPEFLLKEQDLWQDAPGQIGPGAVLDQGLPKPRAEVLAAGKAWGPGGKPVTGLEVAVRVGHVAKRLAVFGNRHWTRAAGIVSVITPPEPFTEMDLTLARAFGGPGFDLNPQGKGIAPLTLPDGRTVVPLPNVEYPNQIIGAPTDRPRPAGLAPLDLMSPQRSKKRGTYDQTWLKTRWPYYPDDLDPEFFNAAPNDLWAGSFFKGDEPIEISNMHPQQSHVRSELPGRRVRCFVTQRRDLNRNDPEVLFKEVATHIDTVWLFPSILKGIAVYRGAVPILDDEYADLHHILLDLEHLAEDPKPIEHYYEVQNKAKDRSVPLDMAPLIEAQKQIGKTIRKFKRLPKDLEAMKKDMLGQSPSMPMPRAEEFADLSERLTSQGLTTLYRLETMARSMKAKFGHQATLDLGMFDRFRAKVTNTRNEMGKAIQEAAQTQEELEQEKEKAGLVLKKLKIPPEALQKAGLDPDHLLEPPPVNPWHDRGFPLVVAWRKNLRQNHQILAWLHELGLEDDTIERAWMGYNPTLKTEDARLWLAPDPRSPEPQIQDFPAGLILPRFQGPVLNRILIRPPDLARAEGEVLVIGSDLTPLFLPTLPLEDGPPPVVVRAPDELSAWYLEQELGDALSVIVLNGPDDSPGLEAAEALARAPVFLIVLPEGQEDDAILIPWIKAFPNAQKAVLPSGHTVFEATEEGVDLRGWLLGLLPPDLAAPHRTEPNVPEPGKFTTGGLGLSIPLFKPGVIGQLIQKTMDAVREGLTSQIGDFDSNLEAMLQEAQEKIPPEKHDVSAIWQKATAETGPMPSTSQVAREGIRELNRRQTLLKKRGLLTPEAENQLKELKGLAAKMSLQGKRQEKELEAGLARLAAAKSGEIPENIVKSLEGLDPDRLKKLTREDVIAFRAEGNSLAGRDLSQADLSGLDLSGADLTGCLCRKTDFSGTDLSRARMVHTLANEAIFAGANLKGAVMEDVPALKACMTGADLSEANLRRVSLQEADLTDAVLTGAVLNQAVLSSAKLDRARFDQAEIRLSLFSRTNAPQADFSKARLIQNLFQDAALDGADFSGSVLEATLFDGCTGAKVRFTKGNLDRVRMGGGSCFLDADFTGVTLRQACLRESDLTRAVFSGAVLDEALIEGCVLQQARMAMISARSCRLAKSDLEGANLAGIDLMLGSLRKARLVGADLRASNLFGVDFFKAVLGQTLLDQANLKRTWLHERTGLLK